MALLALGQSQAQFQKSYGTPAAEFSRSVQPTQDAGYIMAGLTRRQILGSGDATLIKTDGNGTQLWSRVYGGNRLDYFNSVRQVPNVAAGVTYIAAGSSASFSNSEDAYLVGTDAAGTPVFSKVFGGDKEDRFNCIQRFVHPTFGPGYIMVGETRSFPIFDSTGYDLYVVHTDLMGNLINSAIVGFSGDQKGNWIEAVNDGFIIAGTSLQACPSGLPPNQDIYAVKLNFNLGMVWNQVIGSPTAAREDIANCVRRDHQGNYVFTGVTRSYGARGDAFILKLNPAGAFIWMRAYGGSQLDEGSCLLVDITSTGVFYVVSGSSRSFDPGMIDDVLVFKTDQNGIPVWSKVYGLSKPDNGYEICFNSISPTVATGYAITGREQSFGAGAFDAYLIETDRNGDSQSSCEEKVTIRRSNVQPCMVRKGEVVRVDRIRHITSKYTSLLYVEKECGSTFPAQARDAEGWDDNSTSGITVAPNPASSSIEITVGEELEGGVMKIFDARGNMVKEENLTSGTLVLPVADLPVGIYHINVVKEDGTMKTGKFVKE